MRLGFHENENRIVIRFTELRQKYDFDKHKRRENVVFYCKLCLTISKSDDIMILQPNKNAVGILSAERIEKGREKLLFAGCSAAPATVRTFCLFALWKHGKEGGRYALNNKRLQNVVSRETCRARVKTDF